MVTLGIHAAGSDIHSHILLIPSISLYLIFTQRSQLPKEYATSAVWTSLLSVPGLVALIAAWSLPGADSPISHNDYLSLTAFSFVCFFAAGGFLFLGRKWMAAVAFPMAFLVFMAPLPDGMVNCLETISNLTSAEAAAWLFSLAGTPALRDGTVFQLPEIAIEVAQECSGIRSSWVHFITSVLASYLFLKALRGNRLANDS